MTSMVGMAAPLMTIGLIIFGGSHQIYLIVERKNSDQISLVKSSIALLNALAWLLYSLELNNPYLFACNIIGGILGITMIIIVIYYRIKNRKEPQSSH